MRPIVAKVRGLDLRGPRSRRVVVDSEGAMLGPDCVLVRRTPEDYRCATRDEAAAMQRLLGHRSEDPDWLFRQCCRIAKALAEGHIALAQVYGLFVLTNGLADEQLKQLALVAPFIKANFNPDQPRDAHGRWTDERGTADAVPLSPAPATSMRPGDATATPANRHPTAAQLAADNQRENKMVRDIVVRLRLSPDQRQQLHRAISGQGYTYQEILKEAQEMFDK